MKRRIVLNTALCSLAIFCVLWWVKVLYRPWVREIDRAIDAVTPHGGDWRHFPSHLGDAGASLAVGIAAVVVLLILKAWRSALLAALFALVGGWLVIPLKYGGRWAPYLSGHTVGGMLPWGLCLLLVVAALQRRGAPLPPWSGRAAVWLWLGLAVAVGLDRLYVNAHVLSDVLLAWSYGAGLVLFAWWLDDTWHRPMASNPANEPPP